MSQIRSYPSIHHGVLLCDTKLLPFFVRSALLKNADLDEDKQNLCVNNMFEDDIERICRLPFPVFTRMILGKTPSDVTTYNPWSYEADDEDLPREFHDTDALEVFEAYIQRIGDFEGCFVLIESAIPEELGLKPISNDYNDTVRMVFEGDDEVITLPLKNQRDLFKPAYSNFQEIEAEVREAFKNMGVEIPAEMPLWPYIGRISGVMWSD